MKQLVKHFAFAWFFGMIVYLLGKLLKLMVVQLWEIFTGNVILTLMVFTHVSVICTFALLVFAFMCAMGLCCLANIHCIVNIIMGEERR